MPICSLCYSGEVGGGNGDGEECAPDRYLELKAIVDIGGVTSCG